MRVCKKPLFTRVFEFHSRFSVTLIMFGPFGPNILTHSRRHFQYIHVSVDGTFFRMYFLLGHITRVISGSVL